MLTVVHMFWICWLFYILIICQCFRHQQFCKAECCQHKNDHIVYSILTTISTVFLTVIHGPTFEVTNTGIRLILMAVVQNVNARWRSSSVNSCELYITLFYSIKSWADCCTGNFSKKDDFCTDEYHWPCAHITVRFWK